MAPKHNVYCMIIIYKYDIYIYMHFLASMRAHFFQPNSQNFHETGFSPGNRAGVGMGSRWFSARGWWRDVTEITENTQDTDEVTVEDPSPEHQRAAVLIWYTPFCWNPHCRSQIPVYTVPLRRILLFILTKKAFDIYPIDTLLI